MNGADISDQDVYLKTGLHYAVENGNLELCALFVKQLKTLIHAKDEGGRTPLHYAADLGYFKVCFLMNSCFILNYISRSHFHDEQLRTLAS